MRVLSVDPGPATGMALWESPAKEGLHDCTQWVEDSPTGAIDRVNFEMAKGLDAVVCEAYFIAGSRAKEANVTIEIIGAVRWLAYKYGIPFTTQAPADAKNFSTNDKLRFIGWYERASTDHARSATKHLLLFLVKGGYIPPESVVQSSAEEVG